MRPELGPEWTYVDRGRVEPGDALFVAGRYRPADAALGTSVVAVEGSVARPRAWFGAPHADRLRTARRVVRLLVLAAVLGACGPRASTATDPIEVACGPVPAGDLPQMRWWPPDLDDPGVCAFEWREPDPWSLPHPESRWCYVLCVGVRSDGSCRRGTDAVVRGACDALRSSFVKWGWPDGP